VSIVNSYLVNSDVGLLPLSYMGDGNQKYYQFGFVPIKNNSVTRSVFYEFEKRLNVFQQSNQPLFNEILKGRIDLKIHEFDDSIVSGAMKTWKEEALIWHASGYQKFWDTTFRKEFYKYLSSHIVT
jgi:lipopolysaccharide biosynthesis glycosyltransferase